MDETTTENRGRGNWRELSARIALVPVCVAGALCVFRSVAGPEIEWRAVALATLAFAIGPVILGIRRSGSSEVLELPASHSVVFAGALALGPGGAALPAICATISRLISLPPDSPDRMSPLRASFLIVRSSAAATIAALVYDWTGGSSLRPQESASALPVICSAAAYMLSGITLVSLLSVADGTCPSQRAEDSPDRSHTWRVAGGWACCIVGGYILAVLYAFAPAYVLLVPALAAGLAAAAPRAPGLAAKPEERREKSQPTNAQNPTPLFVDSETGLANQAYLDMFLAREVSRSARANKTLAAAVFDIDNARISEKTSASLLGGIGGLIRSALRDYDLVARHSSGRLVVVLPDTGPEMAIEVVERLHSVAVSGGASLSVGVSIFPEDASTPEELINAAHYALNRGRNGGSNQIHVVQHLRKAG